MAFGPPLPPDLMVAAFRNALEELGFKEGQRFEGEQWDDRVMMGINVQHHQAIKSWTRMGRAARLWTVQQGGGRGHKTVVTLLPNRRMSVAGEAQEQDDKDPIPITA